MVGILRMKEMLELKPGKVGVKMQTTYYGFTAPCYAN